MAIGRPHVMRGAAMPTFYKMNRKLWWPRYALTTMIAATSILGVSSFAGIAADASDESSSSPSVSKASNEALLNKLQAMERRIQMLEGQLKQKQESAAAPADAPQPTAPVSPVKAQAVNKPAQASNKPGQPKQKQESVAAAVDAAQPTAPAGPAKVEALNKSAQPASNAPSPTSTAPTTNSVLGLDSPVPGLGIGAYGEVKYGAVQNPAAGGKWQNGFDAHRLVLLPTYAITPNIIFNAEIEFEHAGAGFDNDDKLHGTAEIEQLWVDFKIIDQFNWRAPGIDLVPFGYINQHHEPTQFYSVHRPELYNGLIPSTWKVPGTSVYGTIVDGLRYQILLSTSNEDFGDSFDNRLDARRVTAGPYAPGIDGLNGLAFSRPPLGDFQQLSNAMAVSGKLDFAPTFWPGFAGSVSAYYSPNTTPRGAHGDLGNSLGNSSLTMFDAEFRYRVVDTGLELRGEYVQARFGNPANLRANNDIDPTNNVGKTMYGYSGEVAYHIPLGTILGSEWEAVPFYRYTYQNLQTGGFAGTDMNWPTGAGQTQYHTAGVAVFPSPKVVLKATYQKVISRDPAGAQSDSVLGGVGFFF
jgi:hypothetical protein